MNMSNRADLHAMGQSLLLDSSKDVLGTLEVGQAVVKLQGRMPRPFLISIPEFKIQKGQVTDDRIRDCMAERISLAAEDPTTDDTSAAKNSDTSTHDSSLAQLEMAFLEDVVDHPDSGVAARYKRLGLSGRQGQKLKLQMLEKGLIEEHLETTRSGRLMVIRPSEDGKRALAEANAPA